MEDLKHNLPMSMTMAAFTGIAWYIGVEINISLFLLFKRRRGLYFWSCALISWAVILQPLFIILADFGVWKDLLPAVIMIYLTWVIMVVPQSWVLYSRLHLLRCSSTTLTVIKRVLLFNSIVFTIPTIVIGLLAQLTTLNPNLKSINLIWGRVEMVMFFLQETTIGVLYIVQTRKYLIKRAPLLERAWSTPSGIRRSSNHAQTSEQSAVLWQLIYVNLLIIALDVALLGIHCADMFQLQGAFKPCVYGIKLKVEFVILNRLRDVVQKPVSAGMYLGSSGSDSHSWGWGH